MIPEQIHTILATLKAAGFQAHIAGGAVRDTLLGRVVHDWDVATSAVPVQVQRLFPDHFASGIEHGTITVKARGGGVEVTTFRRDVACDGRHAKVQFTENWMGDALRRDLTINGMFMTETGAILDVVNGQEDLSTKTIRLIGNPEDRILEDHLRILRVFRFAAQLTFEIEHGTLEACKKHAGLLALISEERKTSEIIKTFGG